MPEPQDAFHLVQRLSKGWGHKRGFDGYFEPKYMGSAEYEFGVLASSLRRIRESGMPSLVWGDARFGLTTRTVYFVATTVDPEHVDLSSKTEAFQRWLMDGAISLDGAYFLDHFEGRPKIHQNSTIAWWAPDADLMWTLDPEVADRLLAAVLNPGDL